MQDSKNCLHLLVASDALDDRGVDEGNAADFISGLIKERPDNKSALSEEDEARLQTAFLT